ncbi:CYTH domain-containing protein [Oceanobacillus bengalensis]|uniref:CYTH domain-containing protein n=1 Tax=Oceanobacillus bengalensis TaxID=1435466 RepID=A0A494YVC5_9BACI|nr:CYTH domain-containing protein [Oceanobacillus bengalensis]RKQ14140.1 CYTH domain-containing protein [Oceanobacillus bengalensis]
MTQEIEIEFKNLLTKNEFDHLLDKLPFPEYSVKQTNYYFETTDFQLKDQGCALRIREKNGKYRLTLKEPQGDGLLETHDFLTEAEARAWIAGHIAPKEHTTKQLEARNISVVNLYYYGSLITERREVEYKDVLLVLDHSTYNGKNDYEFELEAKTKADGLKTFQSLMNEHNITIKKTPNKIERFFLSLSK